MEVEEKIKRFADFLEGNYKEQLLDAQRQGKKFLIIDFSSLMKFDPELADTVLDQPEESIKAAEISIGQLGIEDAGFRLRFRDLSLSQKIFIRNIRTKHLGKLYYMEGVVRQKSDVRPQVTSAKFECPACGNVISVLQLEQKFREPSKCSCGRKGRFNMLSKELIDAQRLVLEEAAEDLEGGEQPKRMSVFLKEDLVSPMTERKTNPGSKILVVGQIKEVPIPSKDGGKLTRFELMVEANYVEAVQEDYLEVEISKEEEEKIKELANDPKIHSRITNSMAPSIFGYERIKEALALQLVGGVRKVRTDGMVTRGDMHVLIVGDPGCIAGDSQVALIYKGMEKIQDLGNRHLQPIREVVTKIRKNGKDKYYDFATVFHYYPKQPVLKVVTETGKEVICTYNQPFLTKDGWKRADEIVDGTNIRVMPKIPTMVKKLCPTGFVAVEKRTGHLKEVALPSAFTPELASLCGYIIGDGHIHKRGYSVACYVNNEEADIIEHLVDFWEQTFAVKPSIFNKDVDGKIKTIDDGSGLLRQLVSVQRLHVLEVNSRQVAQSLSFLSTKRVPQQIFKSPKQVISRFISWLFEADGCAFGNGRGRTSVQLKSNARGLLRDVQLLLLYFGIQSRIIENNLCIRRSRDIILFAQHIGFNSEKKKAALSRVLEDIENKSYVQKRKKPQSYERVIKILPAGVSDVFDFEVPSSHTFIANGIVCHNSGKSAMLKRFVKVAPKARFVSGKGVSGAGLCVAPDSLVLTNPGGIHVVKDLVEEELKDNEMEFQPGIWNAKQIGVGKRILTLGRNLKITSKDANQFWRLKAPEQMVYLKTRSGKEITLTANTKLFSIKDGELIWKKAEDFSEKEFIATSREIRSDQKYSVVSISLIKSNPVVYGVKEDVKNLVREIIKKKNVTKRNLARMLGFNENQLYHHWINKKARGNIHLGDLRILAKEANSDLGVVAPRIESLSLYKGKKIRIPTFINEDFMYFAGLVAGDGDLSQGKHSVTIRFSNGSSEMIERFRTLVKNLFGVDCNKSSVKSRKRPESWRFSSNIVFELLNALGIPLSPKSHRLDMSNILLNLPNDLLSAYLRGVFDTDGSVIVRKNGPSYVDLSTTSGIYAKKIQLVLLRYGIHSKLRIRAAVPNEKIKPKYSKNVIEIKGKNNLELFRRNIGFCLGYKKEKLDNILNTITKTNTNVDVVPSVSKIMKRIKENLNLTSRQIFGYKTNRYFLNKFEVSRFNLERINKRVQQVATRGDNDVILLDDLAHSDIFWDEIVKKEVVKPNYDYVYDLTVNDSHNFLVNGFIVHNTASVVKDEFMQGWALEAGALPLCNKGFCAIDEMDKISKEDTSAMHEALEGQTVTISKANVQATLRAETTVLAAANPKFGRFDPYGIIAEQIDMPPTLLNRFDLIFTIKDLPDAVKDEQMARHILSLHQYPELVEQDIDTALLKKYISYARQHCNPVLVDSAVEEIKKYYVEMRNKEGAEEGAIRAIPISARQLEALVRLAEANAKIRMGDKVLRKDARKAIDLLHYCLRQVGLDPETGKIDIDRIVTGIAASERGHIIIVREIINALEGKLGKTIPVDDVVKEAKTKGIAEDKVEEVIERLKRAGDLFEPKPGLVQKI